MDSYAFKEKGQDRLVPASVVWSSPTGQPQERPFSMVGVEWKEVSARNQKFFKMDSLFGIPKQQQAFEGTDSYLLPLAPETKGHTSLYDVHQRVFNSATCSFGSVVFELVLLLCSQGENSRTPIRHFRGSDPNQPTKQPTKTNQQTKANRQTNANQN